MTESSTAATFTGNWMFGEGEGRVVADSSPNSNPLTATTDVEWVDGPVAGSYAIKGDGKSVDLVSESAPLVTDRSFSVAAWVRLDSDLNQPDLTLPPDWFALTAVAQAGNYHSPFYLGARRIEYGGEGTGDFHLHWNFTVSPIDGSDDGPVDWVHAYSSIELSPAELDQWVLLVGVYDLEARVARIFVPTRQDRGEAALPADWPEWNGAEHLHVGQAYFRHEYVDQWPGSIGPIWTYQGVLDAETVGHLAQVNSPTTR